MLGMYSVQIWDGNAWRQIRVFDADWMGLDAARDAAKALARNCELRAIVECFAPGGTTSRGVEFDNAR